MAPRWPRQLHQAVGAHRRDARQRPQRRGLDVRELSCYAACLREKGIGTAMLYLRWVRREQVLVLEVKKSEGDREQRGELRCPAPLQEQRGAGGGFWLGGKLSTEGMQRFLVDCSVEREMSTEGMQRCLAEGRTGADEAPSWRRDGAPWPAPAARGSREGGVPGKEKRTRTCVISGEGNFM
jgi:hypothetical protein